MQFNQNQSTLNATSESSKPKLFKKTNLNTTKVAESKIAPESISIGHNFTLEGQPRGHIEEKVAQLSLQMNQVIVKPYLQQALDYLKNSKHDSINAYNQLSDQIANEIRIISQNTQQISVSLKEAQDVVAKTQEIIRNKYNNAIEEEISSGALNLDYEYNIVAEHYELSLQLTQELSRYKARIDSLLSTQNMLDESIVPSISRLQLEIDNLELLLHSFDSSEYADILAKKTGASVSRKTTPTNDFVARSKELNQLAAAASTNSLNSFEQQNLRLDEMRRYETPNQQKIVTNNYQYSQPMQYSQSFQASSQQPMQQQFVSNEMSNNQTFNNNQTLNQQAMQQGYNGPVPMSKQEAKMMQKLRQQQMKFEAMMRMNEMIFEYNKAVDQMILKQKEYEDAHREQFEAAKTTPYGSCASSSSTSGQYVNSHVYETSIPIETVSENVKKSKNDKLFVVRTAEPITEEQAKEIKNRGSVKSVRVLK